LLSSVSLMIRTGMKVASQGPKNDRGD